MKTKSNSDRQCNYTPIYFINEIIEIIFNELNITSNRQNYNSNEDLDEFISLNKDEFKSLIASTLFLGDYYQSNFTHDYKRYCSIADNILCSYKQTSYQKFKSEIELIVPYDSYTIHKQEIKLKLLKCIEKIEFKKYCCENLIGSHIELLKSLIDKL